jgi:predicted RNA-binding Zn ribbon-like protein
MDVAELHRQVEYKFAPEPLIAIQALANTFDFDAEEERLEDPEATRAWLVESDLALPGLTVSDAEHEELLGFRSLVRDMLDGNLHAEHAPDAEALAKVAAAHPVPLRAGQGGDLSLDLEPQGSVDGVIAQMLGVILEAQTRGEWPRLKICASDECRWAFYDSSKNRGGTWCRMEECGNRVKNRRYRERRSQRA